MKAFLFVLLIVFSNAVAAQDDFCEGWKQGYEDAFEMQNEFKGITPICPIPGIHQKSYQAGYNLGYANKKLEVPNNTIVHFKNGTFCEGWEEGYRTTREEKNEFVGIIPICPIHSQKENNYNIGYKKGIEKALK